MRADRLFSLLMILQTRGRVIAEALAQEMEVSVRTIYRDMEALGTAGIPVYTERGPGGGCCLIDDYRTTLTGLTVEETRALYMLNIPAPLEALGVGQSLKAAMLKLFASLPDYRKDEAEARQRVYLDWAWWGQGQGQQPMLEQLYQAVWRAQLVHITYILFNGQSFEQVVGPLGLVSKAGMWYLVCRTGEKTFSLRVADLLQVRALDEAFERPPDFNLVTFWQGYSSLLTEGFYHFEARVKAVPAVLPQLERHFSYYPGRMDNPIAPSQNGNLPLTLYYENFESARAHLLSLGSAVEVLAPLALRLSIADFAAQTVRLYENSSHVY